MRIQIASSLAAAAVIIASAGQALAQQSSLSGVVLNASDNKPLSGVRVDVYDPHGQSVATTTSDTDGKFTLVALEPGMYTVYMNHDRFATHILYDVPIRGGAKLRLAESENMEPLNGKWYMQMASACERLVWPEQTASLYTVCSK
jgi:hypothetical protein